MAACPVISPEQLTAALQRLDPRDWEVLDLSLRRRVPDEALARLFATEPPEVARRRAFAIEHLADELGVQRGEDLGAVLKALLEPATWAQAEREQEDGWEGFTDPDGPPAPAPPVEEGPPAAADDSPAPDEPTPDAEPSAEARTSETARHFRIAPPPELPPLDLEREPTPAARLGGAGPQAEVEEEPGEEEPEHEPEAERPSHLAAVPPPVEPEEEEPELEAEPDEEREAEPEPEFPPEPPAAPAPESTTPPAPAAPAPAASAPPTNGGFPRAPEPVLDMLAERDQEQRRQRIRTPLLWALAGGLGAIGLFGAGYVGATLFGDEGGGDRPPAGRAGDGGDARRFLPNASGPVAADPFPSDPRDVSCYPTAAVERAVTLHERPGSKRTLKVQSRTEWGSARVFSVVKRRGDWLAVLAPELQNDEVGWLRSRNAKLDCVRWSLHVDLSRRRLFVRKDGRTMRKMTVAIGAKGNPTPKGRFAVTDKLEVVDKGSPYGCCVLALTGHQTRLPPDWPGGDRLAVHATSDLSSIGKAVSLGCMRSRPGEAQWLIKTVPLGSPIFIRA
jgi:L,D-transpeptidase catalytic domain